MADLLVALLATLGGAALGILAGIMPGIHSNTIASLLANSGIDSNVLPFIIIAAFAVHAAVEFLPSIFLGIPDPDTALSVLPGHRLALEGRAVEAVRVCAISAVGGGACAALLFPASLAIFPVVYAFVKPFTFPLLLAACAFLVLREGNLKGAAAAAFVFLISGALGILSLNAPVRDPLLPIFTGMFALSSMLFASEGGAKLPKQKEVKVKIDFKKEMGIGVLLGMFADLLPGMGAPAQMAAFATLAVPLDDARKYLALTASVAASHAVFAFSAMFTTGKARSGALATLSQVTDIASSSPYLYIAVFLIGLSVGALALLFIGKRAPLLLKLGSGKLNALIALYLFAIVAILCGPLGLLILAASAAVGSLPIFLNVKRSHVLGAIIVPAMLSAAGFPAL